MVSGRQILEHFANRLPALEASLPSLVEVKRPTQAPSNVAELDRLRNSYEGEPYVFPATWVPSWTDALGTSAVLQGLQSLLSGIVQVDAFQLQYEACKDVFRRDTFQLLSADFCEQSCTNDDPSTSFSILQSNRESGDTNHFNYKISTSGGLNRDFSNHEKENGDSIIGKTLNVGLTAMDNMLVENGSVTRLYHPVPCSSSQIMDFGVFISELNAVLLQQRNQLLYLTWRGIPALENLDSLPVHAEFHFFIRSLFHPTTSPQFIAEDAIIQRNLWVGAIVTSRIHFDALDNVHACISGTKLFHLYPPSALTNIYPNPWKEGALNNFSSIESIFLVNRAQHAKFFQNVKCWRAEVKAGEAIFIPAGWWHEVFTFQEAVSANIWFKPNPVARFRPTLMHLKSENYYKFMLQRTESS